MQQSIVKLKQETNLLLDLFPKWMPIGKNQFLMSRGSLI